MNIKNKAIVTAILLGLSGAGQVIADNPHEITAQSQVIDCASCHLDKPQHTKAELLETKNHRTEPEKFKEDGIKMCSGCHDAEDGHKVGIKLDFEVPADMPLGEKNKLTCLTCHYTHGNLSSDRPQASHSFIDKILDAERLHKSFLLRRNNTDGELCLTCHEIKEGSK